MKPLSLALSTKSTTAAAMNIFSIERSCTVAIKFYWLST